MFKTSLAGKQQAERNAVIAERSAAISKLDNAVKSAKYTVERNAYGSTEKLQKAAARKLARAERKRREWLADNSYQ